MYIDIDLIILPDEIYSPSSVAFKPSSHQDSSIYFIYSPSYCKVIFLPIAGSLSYIMGCN